MQWIASGFLFVRGHTLIHRLDPRVRLFMALSLFSVALVSHSFYELAALAVIILAIVALARIMKRFARAMVFSALVSVGAFVVYYFTSTPWAALVFSLRLFVVISSTSTFFLTSTPDELEHVMKWLKVPADFVMVFVIAIRFVPIIMIDALQIMDAQRARGLEFDRGNFFQRIRNAIPIFVPLIAVALNRSLDLAEAMDSRAYGAFGRPTSLNVLRFSARDYVALGFLVIGTSFGLFAALFMNLP